MPATELDTTSWTSFESTLALRLRQLDDPDFITIAEGSFVHEPPAKRGLVGRVFGGVFGGGEPLDAGAFVQAHRAGALLYAECVGSRSFGGRHAWTSDQEAALERVGWVHRPALIGEEVYVMGAGADPALNGHVPVGDAPAVAALMVAAMRDVVGTVHPDTLEIRFG